MDITYPRGTVYIRLFPRRQIMFMKQSKPSTKDKTPEKPKGKPVSKKDMGKVAGGDGGAGWDSW